MRRRTASDGAAEEDEAADAEIERVGDGAGLVGEAAVGAPAERRENDGRAETSLMRASPCRARAGPGRRWRRGRCRAGRAG